MFQTVAMLVCFNLIQYNIYEVINVIKLKEYRQLRGLTQTQLSQITSISRGAIANYEVGNREPDASLLLILADALSVSVDELLGRPAPVAVVLPRSSDDVIGNLYSDLNTDGQAMLIDYARMLANRPQFRQEAHGISAKTHTPTSDTATKQ